MDEKMSLEAIIDYEMTSDEAKAYKILILWLDLSHKYFQEYNHSKMTKKDPRKSQIFKYCYKLQRETNGILDESDYQLYVRSQLEILKYNKAVITPACLVGKKAWIRWKFWKRRYDARNKIIECKIPASQIKMADALNKTKIFLEEKLGQITSETIQKSIENKTFQTWVNLGKISPYFLVLANLDFPNLEIYKENITIEIQNYYTNIFNI